MKILCRSAFIIDSTQNQYIRKQLSRQQPQRRDNDEDALLWRPRLISHDPANSQKLNDKFKSLVDRPSIVQTEETIVNAFQNLHLYLVTRSRRQSLKGDCKRSNSRESLIYDTKSY